MHIILFEFQNQIINSEKLGVFGSCFFSLKIGSMLNKSGITKTKGASSLELFTIVFNLAFMTLKRIRREIRDEFTPQKIELYLSLLLLHILIKMVRAFFRKLK